MKGLGKVRIEGREVDLVELDLTQDKKISTHAIDDPESRELTRMSRRVSTRYRMRGTNSWTAARQEIRHRMGVKKALDRVIMLRVGH